MPCKCGNGEYIISHGIFTGQKLNEIGHEKLNDYQVYMQRASQAVCFPPCANEVIRNILCYLEKNEIEIKVDYTL